MVSARFSQLFALVTCLFATLFFWMMLAVGGGGTRMRVAYLKTVFSFFLMVWSLGRHPSNIAGDRTPRRPADHQKEMQIAVVWSCLLFIRSGQNHLARHRERKEEDMADKGKSGKVTSGNRQAWSLQSPRGHWRTGENGGNWLRNHLWCPNDPRG